MSTKSESNVVDDWECIDDSEVSATIYICKFSQQMPFMPFGKIVFTQLLL